jgi:hypothetical protein
MACACSSRRGKTLGPYIVALPGGQRKSYSSEVAARAKVNSVEGAYLIPPTPVSS